MVNVTFLKWLFQLIGKMVKTNDYLWVTITQKNIVTTDSNYNHFFFGCCNWSVFTVHELNIEIVIAESVWDFNTTSQEKLELCYIINLNARLTLTRRER